MTHPITRRLRASAGPGGSRVFDIDIEHCPPTRGGPLTIIAAIVDPTRIAKILVHLGLPIRAPPRSPAWHFALIQTA